MSSKIPERIGRYVVDRLLGQGAMGSVYLGRDPALDRKVAIKTVRDLDLDAAHKQTFLERFRNEARAAGRLSHPSIVAVYDVGEEPELGPFLVFEYVPGSSLKHILRGRGALPPVEAVDIAAQIGGALEVAHAAGIIHRDVKPDNILVSDDGRAKLADFGIARVPDAALTKEGQFLGTPCYAAPETLSRGAYSPQSDLFSFAAVVYELVSGVRAFPGDDAISVAHAVVHDEPAPPSEAASRRLPRSVDAVVMRGLSKDPSVRYGSALELVEALDQAFVEAGLLDARSTSSSSVEEPRGPGAGWVVAGVLAALGLLGVGLVTTLEQPVAQEPDAQTPAPDAGAAIETPREPTARVEVRDAQPAAAPDAGSAAPDTGVPATPAPVVDSGAPVVPDAGAPRMSRLEREDAAKVAIDRARRALAAGRREEAVAELARARSLDPESSDLEEVEALLGEAP